MYICNNKTIINAYKIFTSAYHEKLVYKYVFKSVLYYDNVFGVEHILDLSQTPNRNNMCVCWINAVIVGSDCLFSDGHSTLLNFPLKPMLKVSKITILFY